MNLKEYSFAIQEERRQRREAEARELAARHRAEELEKRLKTEALAHDEEVNGLYEQLLAEKQQVLEYCDQGN
jgi:hypothetical protein